MPEGLSNDLRDAGRGASAEPTWSSPGGDEGETGADLIANW